MKAPAPTRRLPHALEYLDQLINAPESEAAIKRMVAAFFKQGKLQEFVSVMMLLQGLAEAQQALGDGRPRVAYLHGLLSPEDWQALYGSEEARWATYGRRKALELELAARRKADDALEAEVVALRQAQDEQADA